jgi:azurin
VDFPFWPAELQGGFIKARYKPTNRIEIHEWKEGGFGYDEKYVGDLIFSRDLCFIPVDLRFGPRGDLYVCDWYNPVKGHAQYSLRDERRLRTSGRIWRIVPKGATLPKAPTIAGAPIPALLDLLKRREYVLRYLARAELRERSPSEVKAALDAWVAQLDPADPRHRHRQVEAVWTYRNIGSANPPLLAGLLECSDSHARAAATHQLRYWHSHFADADAKLRARANDPNGIVRLEAAIAASYIGSRAAFDALLETLKHPHQGHLSYAIRTSLGSHTLKPYWSGDASLLASNPPLAALLASFAVQERIATDRKRTPADVRFDRQRNVKAVRITTVRERMLYDVTRIEVEAGQPVRLEFINPDATAHNLVLVQPGAADEVGLAATEMAKDPAAVKEGQFIPKSDKIIAHTSMVAPNSGETLRFHAPKNAGEYPYICTFPGHWVIMKGTLVVK